MRVISGTFYHFFVKGSHFRMYISLVFFSEEVHFSRKRLDVQLQQQMHHVLFTLQIFVGRRQGENVRS